MEQPNEETRRWALANVVLGQVRSARTVEVIEVVSITGIGIAGSPVREVTQWFLHDGTEIAKIEGGDR